MQGFGPPQYRLNVVIPIHSSNKKSKFYP